MPSGRSALRAVETFLALQPKWPVAYCNLPVVLFCGGEPRRSIYVLTQAIDLDPRHLDPLPIVVLWKSILADCGDRRGQPFDIR